MIRSPSQSKFLKCLKDTKITIRYKWYAKSSQRPDMEPLQPSNYPHTWRLQRFHKEAVLWKRLAHKNILPVLGVSRDLAEFCLISPWMENGCIMNYLRKNPHVNPIELVCMIFVWRMHFFPISLVIQAQRYCQRTKFPTHKWFGAR